MSNGGGVLRARDGSLPRRTLTPLVTVPAALRRPAFRIPLRALRGGSLTAGTSSSGRVRSTRLKKYSRTSG